MGHRELLLEGALECVREKGYARTTARDIVAASGTNLGSIGYHFGSKEALLNEAIAEGFREWTARVAGAAFAADEAEPLERLRTSLAESIGSFEENRDLMAAFVESLAPASRSPELRDQLAAMYGELRTAVALMVEAAIGEMPDRQAAALASLLIAVIDGLMLQWLLDPGAVPSGPELMAALGDAAALALRA